MHATMHAPLALLFFPACTPVDFDERLTERVACTDLTFWAGEPGETMALEWNSTGQVEEAAAAGEQLTWDFALPAGGVTLHLDRGSHLQSPCSGLLEGLPVVRTTAVATAGSAELTIEPVSCAGNDGQACGTGSLTLTDVVLDDGEELSSFAWAGETVGRIPGG